MGTKEKLIERFFTLPKDFTYDEVKRLFGLFEYTESSKDSYIMHKPHPSNIIKGYVMKQLLTYIRENKLIEKYEQSKEQKTK